MKSMFRRLAAFAVSAVLIGIAPGIESYQAVAQMVGRGGFSASNATGTNAPEASAGVIGAGPSSVVSLNGSIFSVPKPATASDARQSRNVSVGPSNVIINRRMLQA